MPRTINKKVRKTPDLITIWKTAGEEDRYGNKSYTAPVYAWVRYQESSRLFVNLDGREIRGNGEIFATSNILDYGDYIIVGEYLQPNPVNKALEVKDVSSTGNLSGNKKQYKYKV